MPKDKKDDENKKTGQNVENTENAEVQSDAVLPPENETVTEQPSAEPSAPEPSAENLKEVKHEVPDLDSVESKNVDTVTVQPVEFVSFENDDNPVGEEHQNLDMLLDIKLELTVELGRCELPIKKILELTRDSIIELDKIAGEPVSLYANGKHIANGEVVVIEDNFGLRITSIIEPEKRLKSLE